MVFPLQTFVDVVRLKVALVLQGIITQRLIVLQNLCSQPTMGKTKGDL